MDNPLIDNYFSPPSIEDDALQNNHERNSATDLNERPLEMKKYNSNSAIDGVFGQLPTNPKAKVAFAKEEGEMKQRAPPFKSRVCRSRTQYARENILQWAAVANDVYQLKTKKYNSNLENIDQVFKS